MWRRDEQFTPRSSRVGPPHARTRASDDHGSALIGCFCRLPVSAQRKRFDERELICSSIALGGSGLYTSGENISRQNAAYRIPPHTKREIGFRPVSKKPWLDL